MGLLEIHATLETSQFWPEGASDADTTNLLVKATARGFKFNGKTTNAFRNAVIGLVRCFQYNGPIRSGRIVDFVAPTVEDRFAIEIVDKGQQAVSEFVF